MLHFLEPAEDGPWNEYICELIAMRAVSAFRPADWLRLRQMTPQMPLYWQLRCTEVLSMCGLAEAEPLLLDQLDSPDDETRIQAACALQNMSVRVGSQHTQTLRETLARTPKSRPSERADITLLLENARAAAN